MGDKTKESGQAQNGGLNQCQSAMSEGQPQNGGQNQEKEFGQSQNGGKNQPK